MKRLPYLPATDQVKDTWLQHFAGSFATHAPAVGMGDDQSLPVADDAAYWHWCLTAQQKALDYAQAWTTYKNNVRDGNGSALGDLPAD